jgi:hypothetical protein
MGNIENGARTNLEGDRDPFVPVFRAELDEIAQRSGIDRTKKLRIRRVAGAFDSRSPSADYGLVGLALSGGGIRSAAVCLGVVQALASKDVDVFRKVDYLSTVSGGGYIGAAITAGLKAGNGAFPFPSTLGRPENENLRKLRDFSNFLLVGGLLNTLRSIGSIVAGLAGNVMIVLPLVLIAAGCTILLIPSRQSLLPIIRIPQQIKFADLQHYFDGTLNAALYCVAAASALVFLTAPFWNNRATREPLRAVWIVLLGIPLLFAVVELQALAIEYVWEKNQGRDFFDAPGIHKPNRDRWSTGGLQRRNRKTAPGQVTGVQVVQRVCRDQKLHHLPAHRADRSSLDLAYLPHYRAVGHGRPGTCGPGGLQ